MNGTDPTAAAEPLVPREKEREASGADVLPAEEFFPAEPKYPTGQTVLPPSELPGHAHSGGLHAFLRAPGTYLLIGVNLAVFAAMVLTGVNPRLPSQHSLLRFGANNAELVLAGEWWRVLSAMFVHVGAIHLFTNMWCLWNLGLLGEPLLGVFGILAVYLISGAAGNLLSIAFNIAFQNAGVVGAGASGAVFGIAGILIVLLSNPRLAEPRANRPGIPLLELRQLRRSVINFAGINLLIGLGTIFVPLIRIDNMAHLGGFLSGLALGLPLIPAMTRGRANYLRRQRLTFAGAVLVLLLFATWIVNFHG